MIWYDMIWYDVWYDTLHRIFDKMWYDLMRFDRAISFHMRTGPKNPSKAPHTWQWKPHWLQLHGVKRQALAPPGGLGVGRLGHTRPDDGHAAGVKYVQLDGAGSRHPRRVEHVVEPVLGAGRLVRLRNVLSPVGRAARCVHVQREVEARVRLQVRLEREPVLPLARAVRRLAPQPELILARVGRHVQSHDVPCREIKRRNGSS